MVRGPLEFGKKAEAKILSGNCDVLVIEYADLVTEMRSIKHPFDMQGIQAQPGVEF